MGGYGSPLGCSVHALRRIVDRSRAHDHVGDPVEALILAVVEAPRNVGSVGDPGEVKAGMAQERAGDAWPEVVVPEEAHGASSCRRAGRGMAHAQEGETPAEDHRPTSANQLATGFRHPAALAGYR